MPGLAQTIPGLRVSFDDPTAHVDQDWSVTYEGQLPAVSPAVVQMSTSDGYQTLTLSLGPGFTPPSAGGSADAAARVPGGGFCELGVEDWDIGRSRARQVLDAMDGLGLPEPPSLAQWATDYAQLVDDIPTSGDAYWQEGTIGKDAGSKGSSHEGGGAGSGGGVNECWVGTGLEGGADMAPARYQACANQFGSPGSGPGLPSRDFPILQAYDGALIVGRYGWTPQPKNAQSNSEERTGNRVAVGPDPSNAIFLKYAACCFHHQVGVRVRTGGEWLAVGTASGLLHHVVTDARGRCVLSCSPLDVLRNARAFDVPFSNADQRCAPPHKLIDRASPLALRNPMFSFVMWGGCDASLDAGATPLGDFTSTERDTSWKFSMRGGFSPLTIPLGGSTNIPVVPQSMAFARDFGQLAIVDGAQQGLILIDLNTLGFAHTPYF
jgi:hypothetical protein